MDFESLVETIQPFYGVCDTHFKLSDIVFNALEDESDGYRSYLDSVVESDPDGLVFPQLPFAEVKIGKFKDAYSNGYTFTDIVDGHLWLEIGTEHTDDYYPCFMFHYYPKNSLDT